MNRKLSTLLLFVIVLTGFSSVSLTIDGRTREVEINTMDDVDYITTDVLAEFDAVGGRYFTPVKNKETQKWGDDLFVFTPFSPFVVIDKEPYSMGLPTYVDNSGHYVPLWGLLRVVNKVTDHSMNISWDDADDTATPESPKPPTLPDDSLIRQPKFDRRFETPEIWTVVVDPGHGGKDPGAIGKDGTYEKDIVLDIARIMKELSETDKYPNIKIELTRNDDTFIPLNKRGEIAVEKNGHIFISVHANASEKEESHGVETFFLSPAKTGTERATEILENSAALLENNSDIIYEETSDFIFADFLQNEFIRESSRLSEFIASGISDDSGLFSRGKSKAGFFVLKDVVMPAVLVEVAFISNPDEEKLLNTPAFRKKIAASILDGIASFTKEFGQ